MKCLNRHISNSKITVLYTLVSTTFATFKLKLFFFSCPQFPQRFSCYQHYCWEEENSLEFARRQMESNPHFLIFIQVNIPVAMKTHALAHSGVTKCELLKPEMVKAAPNHHRASTVKRFCHRCFSSDVISLHLSL